MDVPESIKIMRALANGVDPETGEAFETTSVFMRPQTIKALNRALSALAEVEQREKNRPANAGKVWTRAEDAQVCEEVRRGIDFHEIAKMHLRSVGSIVARLVKLGKIAPPPEKVA